MNNKPKRPNQEVFPESQNNKSKSKDLVGSKSQNRVLDALKLALRIAVASTPYFGAGASILLEDKINKDKQQKIENLLNEIISLQREVRNIKDLVDVLPYSEELLIRAINHATDSSEKPRGRLFARILYFEPDNDPSEHIRSLLLDIAATITSYELALIVDLLGPIEAKPNNIFQEFLTNIEIDSREYIDIKKYSIDRLVRLGLITDTERPHLTQVGKMLGKLSYE